MLIDKSKMPLVAMDFMNEVHKEDVDIINELYEQVVSYEKNPNDAIKTKIDEKYKEWINHTIGHFEGEEAAMKANNFPAYTFHKNEHENVLKIMDEIFAKWQETNDIEVLKNYFTKELPAWLVNHIQTMDTVTGMFLKTGFSTCSMNCNSN